MKRFMKDPIYYGSIALTWIILCCYAFGVAYTQADEDDVSQTAEICIAALYTLIDHYHLVDGSNPDETAVDVVREEYHWWVGFHSGFNNCTVRESVEAASDEALELTTQLKEEQFAGNGIWMDIITIGTTCANLHADIDKLTK